MNFIKYKKWFTTVFGSEATKVILDDRNECIGRDEKNLKDFFKKYQRIEPIKNIKNCYTIKGCNECISKGIIVRRQDSPGFLGKLNKSKYIVVGLEANIKTDIHIAYDQFETKSSVKEILLFKRLKLFFPQIKEKAYIIDIAKCRSTNLHQSRQICLKTHFLKELEILLEIINEFKIILQGTGVGSYFTSYLKPFSNEANDEIKTKKGNRLLFKRQYLELDNKMIPTIIFPHASVQNSYLWNEIEEKEVLAKIKSKLKEFNFNN